MKYIFFIISTVFLILASAGTTFAEAMSYESYSTGATAFCDNTDTDWNKTSRLVAKITYPELQSDTVNAWMSSQIAGEQSVFGREKLQKALDPARIGSFDGWRALEVAQTVYNTRMNTLFDCAVIESRMSIITGLQNAKAITGKSEITDKLKKEFAALVRQKSGQCLPDEKEAAISSTPTTLTRKVTLRMVDTAVFQNCHYVKYLTYLTSRIDEDMSNTLSIDTQIGTADTRQVPTDTDAMRRTLWQRQEEIRIEIIRAERTLPRALLAYQEMARTYGAHLMLVIVYDDYVRLRDNLAKYTSATSQLFEKAYNAMTP
jgi:hypothetical protein